MQAIVKITAKQGIAALSEIVESGGTRYHESGDVVIFVVMTLDQAAPVGEFVYLIKNKNILPACQLPRFDFVAVLGVVPIEICRVPGRTVFDESERERGFANLPREGNKNHLFREILPDGGKQIP